MFIPKGPPLLCRSASVIRNRQQVPESILIFLLSNRLNWHAVSTQCHTLSGIFLFLPLLSLVSPPLWYCNLSRLFLIWNWIFPTFNHERKNFYPIPVCPALGAARVQSFEGIIYLFFFRRSASESRSSPKAIKSRQSWRQMEVSTRILCGQMAQAWKRPSWDHHRGSFTRDDNNSNLPSCISQQNMVWASETEAQSISVSPLHLIIANECVTLPITF